MSTFAIWLENNSDRKKEGDKRYYKKNKKKHNERAMEVYFANHEERKAINRARPKRDPERTREYRRKKREEHKDVIRVQKKNEYERHKPAYIARGAKRKAVQLNATPPWADQQAIAKFYEKCARITAETGVEHHVDHVIPLQGKNVCGLHVHTNLQILPATENLRKSNRF